MVLSQSDLELAKTAFFAAASSAACAKIDPSHLSRSLESLGFDSLDLIGFETELEDEVERSLGEFTPFLFDYSPDKTLDSCLTEMLTTLQNTYGAVT